MSRGRAYTRDVRQKQIRRKSNIIKMKWMNPDELLLNERFIGTLNKGKVHCSCYLCSEKSKRDGYKARDRRELERVRNSEFMSI